MPRGIGTDDARQTLYKFIDGCIPDKYIDAEEEEAIINKGMELGIWKGQTEAMINHRCKKNNCTRETEVRFVLGVMLEESTKDDGVIDKKEFDHVVGVAVALRMPRKDALRICVEIVTQHNWKTTQEGVLRKHNWFQELADTL